MAAPAASPAPTPTTPSPAAVSKPHGIRTTTKDDLDAFIAFLSPWSWLLTGALVAAFVCVWFASDTRTLPGPAKFFTSLKNYFVGDGTSTTESAKLLAENPLTRDMAVEFPSAEPIQWEMTFLDPAGVSKGFSRLKHVDHETKDGKTVLGIPAGAKRIIRFGAYRADTDKWKPSHLSMVYSGASDGATVEKFDGRCEPRFATSPTVGIFTLQPGVWLHVNGAWVILPAANRWSGVVHPENRKDLSERFIIQKLF